MFMFDVRLHLKCISKLKFTSNVISCVPATVEQVLHGKKKEKIECFEVILEDTVFFPEGGGQVCFPHVQFLFNLSLWTNCFVSSLMIVEH